MNQKNRLFHFIQISIFSLTLLFTSACSGNLSGGDNFLFGLSEAFDRVFGEEEITCSTSEVTVTTRQIFLEEDGNVNSIYDLASSNGITDSLVPATGTIPWGYRTFETCIYPNLTFNSGSLEFTVEQNNTYGTRVTSERSFPLLVNGNPIPNQLTFTSHGETARQCFKFTAATNDLIRNPTVNPMTINFGEIVQKDANGEVVSGNYVRKKSCGITLTLEDDEAPGVRVSNISRVMEEPGPNATATNGTFTVVLRGGPPTHDVTIPINDTFDSVNASNREGTATPTTLTFTAALWDTNQTVTVSSHDDLELDGLKTYLVQLGNTTSVDPVFNGLNPRDVVVYNRDKSEPGFSIVRFSGGSPILTSTSSGSPITGFASDENNQFGNKYSNFEIKLRTKPTNDVTLNFSSANCGTRCTIITPSLTFTPTNWNTNQTFRVEGNSDAANGGNQDYTVTFTVSSSDTTYTTPATVAIPSFTIRSCDNDHNALIQPCNFSGSPRGINSNGNRLSAVEGGSSQIWLITQTSPGSAVTVTLSSTDTSEGTVPANVTIDSANFNVMETGSTNRIALSHVDDIIVDLTQVWTVETALSTGGLSYNPIDIFAQTTDDEKSFYVGHTGNGQEGTGSVATVSVCLGANNPTQPVVLNITCRSYGASEAASGECGTITPTTITFPIGSEVEPGNASDSGCANSVAKRQTFTVSGADDTYADGTQNFDVTITMVANTDTFYTDATSPGNHTIQNLDNEPAGKRVFVTSGTYNGEMTAQGVFGADDTCNNNRTTGNSGGTYKALIVSNSGGEVTNDRLAGGINWTLTSNRHYYRCTGTGYTDCSDQHTRLFIANGSGTFSFPMSRDFSTNINDEFWTGMQTNLSPATQTSTPAGTCVDAGTVYRHNCHGFTYQTCPTSGGVSFYGQIWKNNGSGSIVSSEAACTASKKLICVEQ